MPLTPEEEAELAALEAASDPAQNLGAASVGLTPEEEAELGELEQYDAPTTTAPTADTNEPGFIDYIPLAGIPADIYDIATDGFNSPDIVARRERREQAAKDLVPIATGILGAELGAIALGPSLIPAIAGGAIGGGSGDILGQGLTRDQLDLNEAAAATVGGGIGVPLGRALQAVGRSAKPVLQRIFGGPGVTQTADDAGRNLAVPDFEPRVGLPAQSSGGRVAPPGLATEVLEGTVIPPGASRQATAGELDRLLGPSGAGGGGRVPPSPPTLPASNAGAGGGRQTSKFLRQLKILDDAGVGKHLTPGQRSGNTTLIAEETTAAPTALGGKIQTSYESQGQAVRGKLMEMAGFEPDDIAQGLIDPDTVANAASKFSQRYTDAFKDVAVKFDTQSFDDAIRATAAKHRRRISLGQKAELDRAVEDLRGLTQVDEATGKAPTVTGEEYQDMRSILGARERSFAQRDPAVSDMFKDLKASLDDAFASSTTPENAALKRQIDREYRNFKVLEKASQGGGADVAAGEPTIKSIANKARNKAKGGTKEFRDLADAAQAITVDRVGNSFTASRADLLKGLKSRLNIAGIRAGQGIGLGR